MRSAWICLFFLGLSFADGARAADQVLERVVMVSRHGVRSPIRPIAVLDALTQRRWPQWPVGPGEMTEHGARNLALMADFLRETYRGKGLLPASGCPPTGAVDVWSDAADHRTRESGEIFAQRLAPGCGVEARHAAEGVRDPLFKATNSDACPIGLVARAKSLASSFRQSAIDLGPSERRALETVQRILAPDACRPGGSGVCVVPEPDASTAKATAKIGVAAVVAEGLYLEYAQGFALQDVGWGQVASEATIASVMPAYERGINFMRRNPLVSARRGALLAQTILRLVLGAKPSADAAALSPDAKLVMIAGHDSNLLQSAVLMGLDWQLPNQPTFSPPDMTLAFEVWRDPATDRRSLRIVAYAQTLAQLRDATTLDVAHPPDVVAVRPQACALTGENDCTPAAFAADVEERLASLCKG